MRAPTAAELLMAWELGLRQPPLQRALTLLASAYPDASDDELWTLSIGQRDARLLQMRRCLFGPALAIVGSCPACEATLESSINVDDIRRSESDAADRIHVLDADDLRVSFRLPNSLDLVSVVDGKPLGSARGALLQRCVSEVRDEQGGTVDIDALPDATSAAVVTRMAQLDPQADVQLDMTCPSCEHRWSAPFDIASFLWKEIHAWAQRTLRDVHRLARAYGWSEAETLALSPTRRQIYLELCRA